MEIEYTHGLLIRALTKESAIKFYKELVGNPPPTDGTIVERPAKRQNFYKDYSKVWEFLPPGGLDAMNKRGANA